MKKIASIVGIICSLILTPVLADEYDEKLNKLLSELDSINLGLRQVADSFNVHEVDALALGEKFDFDADKVVEFVASEIDFDSYTGMLRGEKGTLLSGSGNALDQSILLAVLLGDIGYDARIQNGQLSETDAKLLLSQMFKRKVFLSGLDKKKLKESVMNLPDIQEKDTLWVSNVDSAFEGTEKFKKNTSKTSGLIHKILLSNNVLDPKKQNEKTLISEAQNYFWVEYKMGPQDDWKIAHPAFGRLAKPVKVPEVVETYNSSIPEKLQHRIRIELLANIVEGGKLITKSLMAKFERPAGNMIGIPLTFSFVPNISTSKEAILKSKFFIPNFNNSIPSRAKAFHKLGLLVDPKDIAGEVKGAAGLFASMAENSLDASNNLGGMGAGSNSESLALGSVYLQITIFSPGKKKIVERHYWLDRVYDRKSDKDFKLTKLPEGIDLFKKLTGTITFMTGGGRQKFGFAVNDYATRVADKKPLMELMARKFRWPEKSVEFENREWNRMPVGWPLANLFLSQLIYADDERENSVVYRDAPFVALHKQGASYLDENGSIVDIISNPVRAYNNQQGKINWDSKRVIEQGIYDTYNESIFSGNKGHNAGKIPSKLLSESRVIKKASELELSSIKNVQVKNALQDDLKQGYVLLLPDQSKLDRPGWWRVDPLTGQTLGMIDNGLGGEFVEDLQFRINLNMALMGCLDASYMEEGGDVCGCTVSLGMGLFGHTAGTLIDANLVAGSFSHTVSQSANNIFGANYTPDLCPDDY